MFIVMYIFFGVIIKILVAILKYIFMRLRWGKIPDANYKSVFQLQEEAYREGNDFKLKIIEDHEKKCREIFKVKNSFFLVLFELWILSILDFLLIGDKTIIHAIIYEIPYDLSCVFYVILIAIAVMLFWELRESDAFMYEVKWYPKNNKK